MVVQGADRIIATALHLILTPTLTHLANIAVIQSASNRILAVITTNIHGNRKYQHYQYRLRVLLYELSKTTVGYGERNGELSVGRPEGHMTQAIMTSCIFLLQDIKGGADETKK